MSCLLRLAGLLLGFLLPDPDPLFSVRDLFRAEEDEGWGVAAFTVDDGDHQHDDSVSINSSVSTSADSDVPSLASELLVASPASHLNFSGLVGFPCGCVVFLLSNESLFSMFAVVRLRGFMSPRAEVHIVDGRLSFCVLCWPLMGTLDRLLVYSLPAVHNEVSAWEESLYYPHPVRFRPHERLFAPRCVWRSSHILSRNRSRSLTDLNANGGQCDHTVYYSFRLAEYGIGELTETHIASRRRRSV